jgi:DNA-binding response OmpR family regulator
MPEPRPVLLVDDDASTLEIAGRYLERAGFAVHRAACGANALTIAAEHAPGVVVLDVNLPDLDGFAVLERLRVNVHAGTRVLMLSARGEERDRLRGLEGGADDYLVKPFSPRELVARVKILWGRAAGFSTVHLRAGALELEPDQRRVRLDNKVLELTTLEFDLLHALMARPEHLWTRDALLSKVWGEAFAGVDRVVDVHISSLRRKLGAAGKQIQTVRGAGYRFRETP